jgi:hypothetical protein
LAENMSKVSVVGLIEIGPGHLGHVWYKPIRPKRHEDF